MCQGGQGLKRGRGWEAGTSEMVNANKKKQRGSVHSGHAALWCKDTLSASTGGLYMQAMLHCGATRCSAQAVVGAACIEVQQYMYMVSIPSTHQRRPLLVHQQR
eukprot:scaffold24939_cov21-Tisochrysis_lutea.AAC.1